MSIWLPCKAVLLTILVLVTIPFVLFLLVALWGRSCTLVIERDSWLARVRRPAIQGLVERFLA